MTEPEAFEAELKKIAAEFAGRFDPAEGTLDFSKQSLPVLDASLLKARVAGLSPEALRDLAIGAGAYLAEVIRKRAPLPLRWVPSSIVPGGGGPQNPYLLATPRNLVFAILSKPSKLLEKGEGERLAPFADAVQDLISREATSKG
jgi:hypothetical protein